MLFEAIVITLVVLVLGYKLWQEWNHGELKSVSSLFQAMNEANNDLFGGETRALQCVLGGKEKTVDVKTLTDVMSVIMEVPNGSIYLQSSREHGLHLEFEFNTEYDDDMLVLRMMKGNEMADEQTINLDKIGPMGYVRSLQTLFGDLSASSGAWWNE